MLPPVQSVSTRATSTTVNLRVSSEPATPATKPAQNDSVTLGQSPPPADTYGNPRTSAPVAKPDLATLLADSEIEVTRFMQQLRNIIGEQGLSWNRVFSGEQKISAAPADIAAAQEAISEDGEFGVRKTAERILNFALGATGGDPANLDKIRAAVQTGFDAAREVLGGSLPSISEDTYKAVMDEMARWGREGLPSDGVVSLVKPDVAAKVVANPATSR
jgi:hypothetical protein